MSFAVPPLLLLALALLPVVGAFVWLARWRRGAARRLVGMGSIRISRRRRILKAGLLLSALALIVVAAARPQRGSRKLLLPREGTDVMIVLDVSASMLANDVTPNRIERAKVILGSLLDRLQGDRVGLTVFAGSASLRFPLTTDINAARELINGIAIKEGGLSAGTGIGDGIRLATTSFPPEDQTRGKVMIVVSDGEDLSGAPQDAVRNVTNRGIILSTMGLGTEAGGSIIAPAGPRGTATPRIDQSTGQPATSRANEGLLRNLADAGKGRYIDGAAEDAAAQIADDIGRLARTRFESQEGTLPIERFQPFIIAALLLLLIDFLIPDSRRPRPAAARPRREERGARSEERGRKPGKVA